MHTLAELLRYAGVTSHKRTMLSIRQRTTNWGRSGRGVRHLPCYTVWYDTEDRNDRVVFTFEVVLNIKRTAPEKLADINIQISHYSNWDPVKRRITDTHPERYLRIDGMADGGSEKTKALWQEITALTEGMEHDAMSGSYETVFLPV